MGRETHPWAPEAEREADWAAAPNFQRRVEVRGGRCLPGECLFISAAPPPRVPPPHVPPAQWVLARGLAVRSGGAGGSASLPRGGPHGGWFHAGYFDSPDTRIRCVVSNTERRARLAEDRAVRTWLVGNGGARVECARRIQGVRVCLRWNGRWMWLVRSGSKVQVQR